MIESCSQKTFNDLFINNIALYLQNCNQCLSSYRDRVVIIFNMYSFRRVYSFIILVFVVEIVCLNQLDLTNDQKSPCPDVNSLESLNMSAVSILLYYYLKKEVTVS